MSRSKLLLTSALALSVGLSANAQAFSPDEAWTRWNGGDKHVRSLDFTAPGVLHAATEGDGILLSTTAGATWSALNGGLDSADKKAVRQVVSCGSTMYAATTAGLFTKSLNGMTWLRNEKLNAAVQAVACPPGGAIVVGTVGSGVMRSADGGQSWVKAPGFPSGEHVWHIKESTGVLYAAGASGVYRSLDAGASWTLRSDGLPWGNAYRVEVAPGNPTYLYAATSSGVFRSINAGETWTEASGAGGPAPLGNTKVRAMQLVPGSWAGADRFFVGTENGVWATRDGGKTWGQMAREANGLQPWMGAGQPEGNQPYQGGQIVWALGMNPVVSPAGLFAGTQAKGVYSIPFKPVLNTKAPVVDVNGAPAVDEVVTADPGTWSGTAPIHYTFAWMRCSVKADPSKCAPIEGATSQQYVVDSDDANSYLRVRVTARGMVPADPEPKLSEATDKVTTSGFGTPSAPAGAYPRIVGPDGTSAHQRSYAWGTTMTAQAGTWQSGTTLSHQWQRCTANATDCKDISGATGATYKSVQADAGGTLKVVVNGANQFGGKTVWSGTTMLITERIPVNVQAPRIVGDARPGAKLDSTVGAWEGYGISYFRTWQLCDADGSGCSTLPGGNASTYEIPAAFNGKRLRLKVEASNAAGTQDDVVAYSAPTDVISDGTAPAAPPAAPAPAAAPPAPPVTGQAPIAVRPPVAPRLRLVLPRVLKAGATVKAPAGVRGLKFRWLRDGKAIEKAAKRTYRIAKADRGHRLALRITLAGGRTVTTAAVRIPRR